MRQRDTGELIGLWLVATVCVAFLLWIGTALLRWHEAPPKPHEQDPLTSAIQACEKNGGVPYTDYKEVNNYTEKYLRTCEYKPANPTQ